MPISSKSVSLDTRVLDGIIRNHRGNAQDEVKKAAFMIEGRAKIKAPVDTGALRSSIGVSMKGGAPTINQRAGVDYIELPVPRDELTAHVGPTVEYGQAVELGTNRQAAQPYMLPALREVEDEFRRGLGQAVSNER